MKKPSSLDVRMHVCLVVTLKNCNQNCFHVMQPHISNVLLSFLVFVPDFSSFLLYSVSSLSFVNGSFNIMMTIRSEC